MLNEIVERKTLSFDEAHDLLYEAGMKVKDNQISKIPEYQMFDPLVNIFTGGILLISGIGFIAEAFFPGSASGKINFESPITSFFIGSASLAVSCIPYSLLFYNGSTRNKLGTFFAKFAFTKKMKKKLEAHQKKYAEYMKSKEVFELYVSTIRRELEEKGVFEVLNRENDTVFSLEDDGVQCKTNKGLEELNSDKVDKMLNEITHSPVIQRVIESSKD